jgi:hypothetical protein
VQENTRLSSRRYSCQQGVTHGSSCVTVYGYVTGSGEG